MKIENTSTCAPPHSPYLSTSTIGACAVDGQLIYKGLQLLIVPHVFVATIVPKEESTRSLKSVHDFGITLY